jgi:adenosylhomocysteine nucleosidase
MEAKAAHRLTKNILISGGRPDVAGRHAQTLIDGGATSLMSVGIAGGLAPGLKPGTVIVADEILADGTHYPALAICAPRVKGRTGAILGSRSIVASVDEKSALFAETSALAVDMESGPVARAAQDAGIPFIALRVIADPAWQALPPAALLTLSRKGRPRILAVLWSILRHPRQISALMETGRNTQTALLALRRACWRLSGE